VFELRICVEFARVLLRGTPLRDQQEGDLFFELLSNNPVSVGVYEEAGTEK
jgi:hypothetical protein